jgi:hypothetical protein
LVELCRVLVFSNKKLKKIFFFIKKTKPIVSLEKYSITESPSFLLFPFSAISLSSELAMLDCRCWIFSTSFSSYSLADILENQPTFRLAALLLLFTLNDEDEDSVERFAVVCCLIGGIT